MSVRLALPTDAHAIAEVHTAAWRAAYIDVMPQKVLDGLSIERRALGWKTALSTPSASQTAVATDSQDAVVGFCVYGPLPDTPTHGELFVINLLPNVWRQGFGRQLFEHVLHHAQKESWHSLALWVIRENTRARAFYEQMGCIPDGTAKVDSELVGAPLHELRYSKPLISSVDPQGGGAGDWQVARQ